MQRFEKKLSNSSAAKGKGEKYNLNKSFKPETYKYVFIGQ